jgi:phasin family protein
MSRKGNRARPHLKAIGDKSAPQSREETTQTTAEKRNKIMNTQTVHESINHVEKVAQNVMQACEEAQATAREHVDAAMRSASVALEGCGEINKKLTGLIQESVARAVNAGKTLATAKSLQEAADIHADYVRESFDSWIAGTGRISEISARVTKEALDPLAEQTNSTITKIAQRTKAAA